jgi:hypothetical protein
MLALPGPAPTSVTSVLAHARSVLAAYPHAVVSHESAALVHGLWLPALPSGIVHLTASRRPDRVPRGVRVHGSHLPASMVVQQDGVPLTSLMRTAVDIARGRSVERAVVVLDSAVRLHAASCGVDLRCLRHDLQQRREVTEHARRELWAAYATERRWPFTVVVRTAIPLVDAGSESPAESRSRVWIEGSDLPRPTVSTPVTGASGSPYVADFLWEEWRVIGEVDGTAKYGSTEDSVRRSLRAERRRQRDLEDAGYIVVRWEATEAKSVVLARIRRALRAAGCPAPSGLAHPTVRKAV